MSNEESRIADYIFCLQQGSLVQGHYRSDGSFEINPAQTQKYNQEMKKLLKTDFLEFRKRVLNER